MLDVGQVGCGGCCIYDVVGCGEVDVFRFLCFFFLKF